MEHLLLVDVDEDSVEHLTPVLHDEGYHLVREPRVQALAALHRLDKLPAAVLVGAGTEDTAPPAITRTARAAGVPVIVVADVGSDEQAARALDAGADDYVSRSVSGRELAARIRAVRRRLPAAEPGPGIVAGQVRLDLHRHVVELPGRTVALPPKELRLLEVLMRNADRAVRRAQLLSSVWGTDNRPGSKTLDVHIKRLRGRLEPRPDEPRYVVTIRGIGYKLVSHPPEH